MKFEMTIMNFLNLFSRLIKKVSKKIMIMQKKNYDFSHHFLDFAKIKNIETNYFCSGCSACKNVCSKNAITMQENEEGFLVPNIDNTKCNQCGLCNKICPIINFELNGNRKASKCYAIQASDNLREKSSSGAVFPVLATYFLKNGGFVCGAQYNDDFTSVEHTVISQLEKLPKLLLSKYLQSDTKNVFKEIKKLLIDGKKVLFVGTPCQVAGLKSFLQEAYENLFLIDLVCCGIPSRKLYRKYLDEIKCPDEKIKNVKFRMKDEGWYSRAIEITTSQNTYRIKNSDSAYLQAFFRGLSTAKICQFCPYDTINREGDLTIGDFWGVAKFSKALDDSKGTSRVLENTLKGNHLLKIVRNNFKLIKKVPFEWVIPDNKNIIEPIRNKNRREFFYNLDKMSVADNYSKCVRDSADCIVVNNAITDVNYGSMLTAYAIQEVIIGLGKYCKILNHARVPLQRFGYKYFGRKFADEYLNLTREINSNDDFIALNNTTDIFLVGSDQMWALKYFQHQINKILLNFADSSKKKIAISVSFGSDSFEGTDSQKLQFAKALKTFSNISVREESGVRILKNDFDVCGEFLLDPVFILDKTKWYDLSYYAQSNIDFTNCVVFYGWNVSPEQNEYLNSFAKSLNLQYYNITHSNITVEDWLYAIKTCKYLVSNSYHAICFALIFNKPFICINNMSEERFSSLFNLLGYEGDKEVNIVGDIFDIYKLSDFKNINYSIINSKIEIEKEKFLIFLKNALNA